MPQTNGRAVSEGRVVSMLAVLACLLAGMIALEARSLFGSEPSNGLQTVAKRQLDAPNVLPAAPWPSISGVTSDGKSLFTAKTAFSPAEPSLPAPPPPLEQFSLMAVVITPTREIAILKALQSGQIERCEEGGIVGAWTVLAIEDDHVLLEGGGQRTTLYLSDSQPQASN